MADPSGPIALLGSGEFEAWTEPVDRALLAAAASGDGIVAVVPTASALEGPTFDDWARKGLEHYAHLGLAARVIDLRGRDDAERADVVEGIDRASLIFFSGGNPAYLATTLLGSPFWDAVEARLADGAAYAGCSAGACIAGAFAPDSVTDFVWEEGWVPGLQLIPNVWVLPHFDALDRHRPGLRDYFLSRVPETGWALGIDERTAVVRRGATWQVIGEGGAFLSRGPIAQRYAAGEAFSLEDIADGGAGDRGLVLAFDPLAPGSGPIALLSSEQFSTSTAGVDRALLERCGPRVGVVVDADPSNAVALTSQAFAHYRSLGAEPRIVRPDDGANDLDVLFLAGGDPKNLVPALMDSRLWADAIERWRAGMGLAGSSAGAMALCERCLFADDGDEVPTRWGRGLGPMRSVALAVHAATRPPGWLEGIVASAPVDVVAIEDGAGVLLEPGRPPTAVGDGEARRYPVGGPAEPPMEERPTIRLYHRTPAPNAILQRGFVDSLVNPVREGAWEGSWFADVPLPPEDGPAGDAFLVLEVPVEVAERYEWRDPAKPYRQFVLPRPIANRFGPPRRRSADGALLDSDDDLAAPGVDPWGGDGPG
jgi:cyanophycinase-like exopeptidase